MYPTVGWVQSFQGEKMFRLENTVLARLLGAMFQVSLPLLFLGSK